MVIATMYNEYTETHHESGDGAVTCDGNRTKIQASEAYNMEELILTTNDEQLTRTFRTDLFGEWLAYMDARTASTKATYTKTIKAFASWMNANGITQPTRADVIRYRDYLSATKSANTVHLYLIGVKKFFEWTSEPGEHGERGAIYANVAKNVKAPKIDKGHKKDYLTPSQFKQILNNADGETENGKRTRAIFALTCTTGLRMISVSLANVGDIVRNGDGAKMYYQGKGHTDKKAFVTLNKAVLDLIDDYLSVRGELSDDEPLFASTAHRNVGGRMSTRSIENIIDDAFKNAGIKNARLTPHSTRHTAAMTAVHSGVNVMDIKQMLDHSNIATTMIYIDLAEREKNQAENTIANALFA